MTTQIQNLNDEHLVIPAITFCLLDFSVIPRNLIDVFFERYFERIDNQCFFEGFVVYDPYLEINYPC